MKNTAVYVSGLPPDVTVDELQMHFSRAGIIMEDMHTGGPRIRIYREAASPSEADGEAPCKGDALVVYLREESVGLATALLDESQLRPGTLVRVEPATAQPSPSPAAPSHEVDRQTWRREMDRMQRKLVWEEEGVAEARTVQKLLSAQCTLLLFGMFVRGELDRDPSLLLDIQADVREEAVRFGPVRSVTVHEERELVAVRFVEREAATACRLRMDGRLYAGHRIRAELYDGSFRLRPSASARGSPSRPMGRRDAGQAGGDPIEQAELHSGDEEEGRLERFGDWLEGRDPNGEEPGYPCNRSVDGGDGHDP